MVIGKHRLAELIQAHAARKPPCRDNHAKESGVERLGLLDKLLASPAPTAGTGRPVWHYFRDRTKNLNGNAGGGFNRGVAIAGDRLFMVIDRAHIVALNRFTGAVLWDTEMADWKQNYNATSAPLIVGDLVISGTAGGDEGVRGFVAAFDQATGKEAWRFWTVPKKGEPLSETYRSRATSPTA